MFNIIHIKQLTITSTQDLNVYILKLFTECYLINTLFLNA